MTLFSSMAPTSPLAQRLRPTHIGEVVGQEHLLGKGKPLQLMLASGKPHAMIFWGPPGVGKTTLAQLVAHSFEGEFIALSAVFSGIKDIRLAVEAAQNNIAHDKRTILFIDEIHRFNKAQQDALLPHVESGLVVLIGATTENPSFEVNTALLSRVSVYVLKPLTHDALMILAKRAIEKVWDGRHVEEAALEVLVQYADGDARRLFNMIEQVCYANSIDKGASISLEMIETVLSAPVRRFDKQGEQFFDQISALHKSVRGSDPNAALYWLCRMLDAGVDPTYLSRRIVRMAWEDVGLADVRAINLANEAAQTYERLGSPEGELALAQAVIYIAVAAKSNAGYVAFKAAMAYVKKEGSRDVPLHLRNAPTQLMKDLGYGQLYRYAHDEPEGYAAGENYLPEGVVGNWYRPVSRGLEIKIAEKLAYLRELDKIALQKDKKNHTHKGE